MERLDEVTAIEYADAMQKSLGVDDELSTSQHINAEDYEITFRSLRDSQRVLGTLTNEEIISAVHELVNTEEHLCAMDEIDQEKVNEVTDVIEKMYDAIWDMPILEPERAEGFYMEVLTSESFRSEDIYTIVVLGVSTHLLRYAPGTGVKAFEQIIKNAITTNEKLSDDSINFFEPDPESVFITITRIKDLLVQNQDKQFLPTEVAKYLEYRISLIAGALDDFYDGQRLPKDMLELIA